MAKERGDCQAILRSEDCTGVGTTQDHVTPKAIIKLWGLHDLKRSRENLMFLCWPCHTLKDGTTPSKAQLLKEQLEGRFLGLGDHN